MECSKSVMYIFVGFMYKGLDLYKELVDLFGDFVLEFWIVVYGDVLWYVCCVLFFCFCNLLDLIVVLGLFRF